MHQSWVLLMHVTCPGEESGVLGAPRVRGRKRRQTPGLASHIWLAKPYIGIDEHYISIDGGSRIALLYGIPVENEGGCSNLLLRLSSAGR